MEKVARGGTVDNNPVAVVQLIDIKVVFLQILQHGRKWPEASSSCEHFAWEKGNLGQRCLRMSHRRLKDSLQTGAGATGSLSLVPFNPWQLLKATWQWMYGI